MANSYYTFTPSFVPGTKVRSDAVNNQYQALESAFDLLPTATDALTTGTATFAPETGSGNAYVVAMSDTRTSNSDGDEVVFAATHTNTSAATLQVDALGAVALVRSDGSAVAANDILNGIIYSARYDAVPGHFQLMVPAASFTTDAAASAAAAAVSATASAVSATTSAASATQAMQWAVHPEDDDVDGFPGQFSSFHWAQKALAAATIQTIVGDIVTATPPTTEAVTALLQYQDADQTDTLARIGFEGSNQYAVRNLMHGGIVLISAEDTTGVTRTILSADPDAITALRSDTDLRLEVAAGELALLAVGNGSTALYHNNIQKIITAADGVDVAGDIGATTHGGIVEANLLDKTAIETISAVWDFAAITATSYDGVLAANLLDKTATESITNAWNFDTPLSIRSAGNTDAEVRQLIFEHQDGTNRALMGHEASDVLTIRNLIHGGTVVIEGEDAGGTLQSVFSGDPDAEVSLFHDGVKRLSTEILGILDIFSDGNTDTSSLNIQFSHADETLRGFVGYNGNSTFRIENRVHGANVELVAEDASGVRRDILLGDPDANTVLHQAGVQVVGTLTAATGGLEVNNMLTGGGFERVLTVSDTTGQFRALSKTGDETLASSTVLQDDDDLSFSSVPIGKHVFSFYIVVDNVNSTPGIRWSIAFTGSGSNPSFTYIVQSDSAVFSEGIGTINGTNTEAIGATQFIIQGSGIMDVTVAGTFKLQWAQNISDASNTVVQDNSYMTLQTIE